jgi:hypothetical protein
MMRNTLKMRNVRSAGIAAKRLAYSSDISLLLVSVQIFKKNSDAATESVVSRVTKQIEAVAEYLR